ncbi:tail fiber domain-containing protein [Flavobacterium facile]|uniref:tail fiber domain-containing protein n=1 Tax=Flavobacterium facile TaxID=2893174 RepID=UPI002E7814E0|nr:tail fiber domain-containing protein [Flavobacterium sp. T-12]
MLIPRMTQAQRNLIGSPANGLLIYQTDATPGFYYFNGAIWTTFTSGTGWSINGDAGTTPATNFLGTTDAQDFVIATNNTERIRVKTTGNVGINQTNPTAKLHVTGTAPVMRIQDGTEGMSKLLTSNATGVVSWQPSASALADDDWRFNSGSTYADPVYHTGKVVMGRTGTTTHLLDVDNGANTGTTIGIGDVEKIVDGNNEIRFSHQLISDDEGNISSLGTATKRWNTVYATNPTIQTSDGTKKTAIKTLPYGLAELMKLRPVSYYWKEERLNSTIIPQEKKQLKLGLIAQEVQQVIPEVVYTYGWKSKNEKEKGTFIKYDFERIGMNYEELIPLLVKAKQEQDIELAKISAKTNELSNQLQQLLTSK